MEGLRASLKDEITSEIKILLAESQRELRKLLKPKTNENTREEFENESENETRCFFTPTKSVRINSTQNNDPCASRNINFIVCIFNTHLNQQVSPSFDLYTGSENLVDPHVRLLQKIQAARFELEKFFYLLKKN